MIIDAALGEAAWEGPLNFLLSSAGLVHFNNRPPCRAPDPVAGWARSSVDDRPMGLITARNLDRLQACMVTYIVRSLYCTNMLERRPWRCIYGVVIIVSPTADAGAQFADRCSSLGLVGRYHMLVILLCISIALLLYNRCIYTMLWYRAVGCWLWPGCRRWRCPARFDVAPSAADDECQQVIYLLYR